MDSDSIINNAFEQNYQTIFNYCLVNLDGDDQAAMDAVENVFIIAKGKSDTIETIRDVKHWLMSIAKNTVKNIRKKNKRYHNRFILFDPGAIEASKFVEDAAVSWWERSVLSSWSFEEVGLAGKEMSDDDIANLKSKILDTLSDDERKLHCSHYEEGVSIKDLAAQYGKSLDAIRMRLSRISIKLVERIKIYFENERSF